MAAMNTCLAESNKSRTAREATKKRETGRISEYRPISFGNEHKGS
jgi:hypothetical protein